MRFPAPTGLAAAVEASPRFHPLILGKAVANLFVQGGRAGSVDAPAVPVVLLEVGHQGEDVRVVDPR